MKKPPKMRAVNKIISSPLGVAILAMVGAGIYSTVQEACEKILRLKTTTAPIAENSEKYAKVYAIYKALYPHLKNDFGALAEL